MGEAKSQNMQCRVGHCFRLPTRPSYYDPIAEDTTRTGHRTWRDQVNTDLETCSMLANSHSTGSY